MKKQHSITDFIRNGALFILCTVLKVHEHVDLHNSKYAHLITFLEGKMANLTLKNIYNTNSVT